MMRVVRVFVPALVQSVVFMSVRSPGVFGVFDDDDFSRAGWLLPGAGTGGQANYGPCQQETLDKCKLHI